VYTRANAETNATREGHDLIGGSSSGGGGGGGAESEGSNSAQGAGQPPATLFPGKTQIGEPSNYQHRTLVYANNFKVKLDLGTNLPAQIVRVG